MNRLPIAMHTPPPSPVMDQTTDVEAWFRLGLSLTTGGKEDWSRLKIIIQTPPRLPSEVVSRKVERLREKIMQSSLDVRINLREEFESCLRDLHPNSPAIFQSASSDSFRSIAVKSPFIPLGSPSDDSNK